MPLKLYDSYAKKKQIFKLQKGKTVKMYNCGPTVYDYVHIGNLRSFLFADVLRGYLKYRKFKVKQVMNITDVGHMTTDGDSGEDKMSVAMKRENKGHKEIAKFFEENFFNDIDALGIKRAWKYPRASEHVPEMIKIIKKLIKNGHAYSATSRTTLSVVQRPAQHSVLNNCASVYYDISTFPKYGKLSGNKIEDLLAGARVDVIQEKKNPYDFALWIHNPKHILKWQSPWGVGYPGWHLECSAMAMKYLGSTIDIHTGGEDNKFPHHECEIAQSEGATGKQFARFWLHAKHLLVNGKKMSKSLGNFYTLRDLLKKGYSARQIRYLLISSNYRETLNFTFEGLDAARKALERIDEFADCTTLSVAQRPAHHSVLRADKARKAFIAAMDDDLNVSKALSVVFDFIRRGKPSFLNYGSSASKSNDAISFLKEVDSVLGLGINFNKQKSAISAEILKLAEQREQARKEKNWEQADKLRARIKNMGYAVEDRPGGPIVKKE